MEELGGTLLVVDDEPLVRTSIKRFYKRSFTVEEAADGPSAVAIVKERAGEVAVMLIDLTMPKMNGLETLEQVRALDPEIPVILCSGYCVEDSPLDRTMLGGKTEFIQKPFNMGSLTRLLNRLRR